MKYLQTRSDDGTPIRIARWNDKGNKNVLLVHGFSEHLGRYHHIAQFFADKGWRVTAFEFRGHGKSGGTRGHVQHWVHFFEDLQAVMATIRQPMAIVAHSLGGLITLWSTMHPTTPKITSIVLSNPLLGLVDKPSKKLVYLGKVLARLYPKFVVSRDSNPELLSRDLAVVEAFAKDPLVSTNVTARMGQQTIKALKTVTSNAANFSLPLRLLIGGQDQVCDPLAAKEFAANYGGEIDTVVYEQCFHELFNEPEKYEILAAAEKWIGQKHAERHIQ